MFTAFIRYVFYTVTLSLLASLGIRRAHRVNPTWLAQTDGHIGIPNWLSISRIIATVIATDLYLTQSFNAHSNMIANIILGCALATDAFDGFIARKTGQITKVGKFLDPLSDKVISYLAFISFFQLSHGSFFIEHRHAHVFIAIAATSIVFRDFLFMIWFIVWGRHYKSGVGAGTIDKIRAIFISIWLYAEIISLCIVNPILANIAFFSFIIAGVISPLTIIEDIHRLKSHST